jgi:hypothetical protein
MQHPVSHLGIVFQPADLPFEQLDRLIFDSMLVS